MYERRWTKCFASYKLRIYSVGFIWKENNELFGSINDQFHTYTIEKISNAKILHEGLSPGLQTESCHQSTLLNPNFEKELSKIISTSKVTMRDETYLVFFG